ncbi:MAG: hypothetical protein P9M03_07690 [Candidatus Theseobacter exili]|nr:hypothetical protein [Candidatus Theseobacter exili]
MSNEFKKFENWDDDNGGLWSEERWEKELLENEKMVEKYEKILDENQETEWQYSVDFKFRDQASDGCDKSVARPDADIWESTEGVSSYGEDDDSCDENEDFYNELEEIKAYCIACDFASEIYEYVKQSNAPAILKDQFGSLLVNSMKVSANIAGGHGLGYDKETICGNIVKNRWALKSLNVVIATLDSIILNIGPNEKLLNLSNFTAAVRRAIEERVVMLRNQVWW